MFAEWTIALTAGGRLRRIDMMGLTSTVLDIETGTGFVVMPVPGQAQPMVMDMPPNAKRSPMDALVNDRTLGARPAGSATVAGIRCENTMSQDDKGQTVICCRTNEWFGLDMRAEGRDGGQQILMEAIRVEFVPQDPARFRRPAGMTMPGLPGGMMPGLPGGMVPGVPGGAARGMPGALMPGMPGAVTPDQPPTGKR